MNVTAKDSVWIRASPEAVWDFTQDWTRRATWDPAIHRAELAPGPEREVRVVGTGGEYVFRYKLFDRPRRTSLAMTHSTSPWVTGGGGSWDYAAEDGGTRFTQQNSLVLGPGWRAWLLPAPVRWQLERTTRQALSRDKALIESASP